MNKKFPLYALMCLMLWGIVSSCNDDNSNRDADIYTTSYSSTLISAFSLGNNDNVLYNLDSVKFSINQDAGLIYNVDSLPVGTDVTHLTVSMTFPYTVQQAQFHVTGGKVMKDSTFDYKSTTTDSIDFTGRVDLVVTSYDGNHTRTYNIKVNVHKMEPDTLYFNPSLRRDVPNVNGTLSAEKCVLQGSTYYCLTNDGGTYKLNSAANPGQGTWAVKVVDFPFTPAVHSLSATNDALYILSTGGELYRSTDAGTTWTDCGVTWHSLLGGWGDKALGVYYDGSTYRHDEYPRPQGYTLTEVEDSFPVAEASPLTPATNEWTLTQQSMLFGGKSKSGNILATTWGYDGTSWGEITDHKLQSGLPGMTEAVIVPYATYSVDSTNHTATERVTWLLMGGKMQGGKLNNTTYVSYNQGISWTQGGKLLQLPATMPAFYQAQAFVVYETLTTSSSKARRRSVTKPVTSWDVPYIYIVGGRGANGAQLGSVWKGVINRRMFRPIY